LVNGSLGKVKLAYGKYQTESEGIMYKSESIRRKVKVHRELIQIRCEIRERKLKAKEGCSWIFYVPDLPVLDWRVVFQWLQHDK